MIDDCECEEPMTAAEAKKILADELAATLRYDLSDVRGGWMYRDRTKADIETLTAAARELISWLKSEGGGNG